MAKIEGMKIEKRKLKDLNPAEYNPRIDLKPGDAEYEKLRRSIEEFGYVDPIIVNQDGTVIGGHQRLKIMLAAGVKEAEVSVVNLDKTREKALNIALNKTGGDWDIEKLKELIGEIDLSGIDTTITGFNTEEIKEMIGEIDTNWFDHKKKEGTERQEGNEEYNEFLDKFEIKKTTDDCYTPEPVYNAVADWVAEEYKLNQKDFVRPFYPGGDYQKEKYKNSCIVVDNPPFSILAEIINYYAEKGIKFFLFCPALTAFSSSSSSSFCVIGAGADIIYENNASVSTSFVTNLEDERFRSAPELYRRIKGAMNEVLEETRRHVPKYSYPDEVVTSAMLSYYSKYGIDFRASRKETAHIRQLESQKDSNKAIFGSGYLVSKAKAAEKAAAEKAAAEKAAAEKWELSDREREIVNGLG